MLSEVKPIAFRPNDKITEYIKEQLKIHPKKTKTQIVIDALDIFLGETNQGNELFFKYPPNIICPHDHRLYLLETILVSCQRCSTKKHCPLWRRTSVAVPLRR